MTPIELTPGMTAIIPGIRGGYTVCGIDAAHDLVQLQSNRTGDMLYRRLDDIIVTAR